MSPRHELKSTDTRGFPKYGFGVDSQWMRIFEKGVCGRRGVELVISPALVDSAYGAEEGGQSRTAAGVLVPAQVCHG